MKRTAWFPQNRAGRRVMFTNVLGKITTYAAALGISPVVLARVLLICETFLAVDDHIELSRATMESLIEWRDMVYEDDSIVGDAPPPPEFKSFTPPTDMFCGIFDEFREYVEQWKVAPGFTMPIGEDLMIVGNEEPPTPETVSPALTVEVRPNYVIKFNAKMKGMNAVRIEYQRKGGAGFVMIGILTSLPGEITITPMTPGEPETGMIRAIYLKKNEPFGDYSPNYPVTLSE